MNLKKNWRLILITIVCMILTISPVVNMLNTVYRWHITQPEFIEGGIELISFGLIILICCRFFKVKPSISLAFFSLIYLSINGVIIPVIVDLVYFEMIIYIGTATVNITQKQLDSDSVNILDAFIWGISIWGVMAIICSILGYGTPNGLQILTAGLFLVAVITSKSQRYELAIVRIKNWIDTSQNMKFTNILLITIINLIFLALWAKTNTAQDYDSLWYGLRSQYVLIGENSFYDKLGYLSFVYYYPKLVELFYLPISSFGDYSFLQGANIVVLALILIVIKEYLENVCRSDSSLTLLYLSIFVSIPALANISSTAKPDTMGFFFVLFAFYKISLYIQGRAFSNIIVAACALLLCTGTKLTYLLWGGLLFLWAFVICKNELVHNFKKYTKVLKRGIPLILLSICFILGVHARTWLLTGYPLYPTGISFWNLIGFRGKDFLFSSKASSYTDDLFFSTIMTRLYEFIFDPTNLPHVIMLWTSNVLLIFIIFFIFYRVKKSNKKDIALGGIYLFTMVYYMVTMKNPDGNYFILPIVVISLICAKYIDYPNYIDLKHCMYFVGAIILFSQIPIMFISHSSWAWGTKPFTTQLVGDNFSTIQVNQDSLTYYGLQAISDEVKDYKSNDRVIASGDTSGIFFRLPCGVETYTEFSMPSLAPQENISSYDNFEKYLKAINIKALIVSNNDQSVFPQYVQQFLEKNGCLYKIEDQGASCYVVR